MVTFKNWFLVGTGCSPSSPGRLVMLRVKHKQPEDRSDELEVTAVSTLSQTQPIQVLHTYHAINPGQETRKRQVLFLLGTGNTLSAATIRVIENNLELRSCPELSLELPSRVIAISSGASITLSAYPCTLSRPSYCSSSVMFCINIVEATL